MGKNSGTVLRISWLEAFFSSLMIGAGETYFQAFALSMGQGEVQAGLLASWPMLMGAVIQLSSLWFARFFTSLKTWVLLTVGLQAISFIPMIVLGLQNQGSSFTSLFFMLSLYWLGSFAVHPVWTIWITRLVPSLNSGHFFSVRVRFSQLGLLVGLFAGGIFLQEKDIADHSLPVKYGILFTVAMVARGISLYCLSRQKDSVMNLSQGGLVFSLDRFLKNKNQKRFLIALPAYIFMVNISSPFVAPYLLSELKFTPVDYMWCSAGLFAGKFLSLWWARNYKSHWSSFQILAAGVLIAAPGPLFWPLSTGLGFVILLQFYSGLGWGLHELGLQLIFFKDLNEEEKFEWIIVYQFLNSLAILGGSFLGAKYLYSSGTATLNYWNLFLFAGCIRFFLALILAKVLKSWEKSTAVAV